MSELLRSPVAKVETLIRRPVGVVFAAFVEPEQLTRFWLADASAPLAPDATVTWKFLVKGVSSQLRVTRFVANEAIEIVWDDGATTAWAFDDRGGETTLVTITHSGFHGSGDDQVAAALDATGGYSLVLSELKVLLERDESANLVRDKAALIEERHRAS